MGLQFQHPAGVLLRLSGRRIGKALHGRLIAFLRHPLRHGRQAGRKLAHPLEGRQVCRRRVRLRLVVLLPEQVEPYQVEGVDQLPGTGVRGMVAVEEPAVLVQHRPADGTPLRVGVASRIRTGLVGTRQELLHGVLYGKALAERPDDALSFQRVPLLFRRPVPDPGRPRHLRPLRHVPPVPVGGQHPPPGKKGLVLIEEQVFAVRAAAGPVHQTHGLKRGGVKDRHPDAFGQFPCDGLVFIRRARLVQRHHDAQPRRRPLVLARGIDGVGASQAGNRVQDPLGPSRFDGVGVKGYKVPLPRVLVFAPRAFQGAPHEAPDVFQVFLVRLGKGLILLEAFPGPQGTRQLLHEVGPQKLLGVPYGGLPAGSRCDLNQPVILHLASSC